MRIAVVGPAHPYKGGGAQHATELAHRLAAAGHAVTLRSWSAQYPRLLYPGQLTVSEPEVPLFPDTRRELSWARPLGWLRVGRRLAREVDAVVLFVYTSVQVPAYLGILRGVRRRARVVALCNNVLPHERRAVDVRLMSALLARVDAVFVHSDDQARLAESLVSTPTYIAGLPPHMAATPPIPSPADRRGEPFRRLLFFGMVRPYKGLDVLLRALAEGPADVSLRVAGEFWGGSGETEKLVADLGLADRVELRPGYVPVDQVEATFADVDALVLPYRSATASQNAYIAFDHGVPVVATRTGALADAVRDGVDGLVCEPDDVDDLAAALRRFYAPGEPERLRAAVRRVDADAVWTSYVDTLVDAAAGG